MAIRPFRFGDWREALPYTCRLLALTNRFAFPTVMPAATLGIGTAAPVARRLPGWQIARRSLLGYLLLVLAAWSAPSPDLPDVRPRPEQEIKAAYLYRFLEYVEWPAGTFAGPASPIVIGVLGGGSVADDLRAIVAGRRIGQHPIEVRALDVADARDANVLFVGADAASALPRVAPAAQSRATLVVTDFADALGRGSVINFVVVDDRLRFEVSLDAAERSGIKLSSRMLSVALRVLPAR
jgi:hypothetical protein